MDYFNSDNSGCEEDIWDICCEMKDIIAADELNSMYEGGGAIGI
jgi:hypothetical protein